MAKKTKNNRAKMPKVQKLSQEQMDNFLAAIMNSNIGAENAEFAKMLIHGNAWMAQQLELGQLSIAKLRKLFQIQGSEKTPNRKPKNDPASSDNQGLNTSGNDTKGHGRNGADAYQGAAIIEVSHPELNPGDTCPAEACDGRQAMVGTIALYDEEGERQHTMYVAAAPEYGKETFKARLTREIERACVLYPSAIRIGVADGAHDNWDYLINHTDKQTLDFYHATEYLTDVADAIFTSTIERKRWLNDRCHELKHTQGAAGAILAEMKQFEEILLSNRPISWTPSNQDDEIKGVLKKQIDAAIKEEAKLNRSKKAREQKQKSLAAAITYFTNNNEKSRMNYAESIALNHPIGSGVTEAACKTIVKQRLGQSGMQWKDKGAGVILSLRALAHSTGRWEQFWCKVNQCGLSMAA